MSRSVSRSYVTRLFEVGTHFKNVFTLKKVIFYELRYINSIKYGTAQLVMLAQRVTWQPNRQNRFHRPAPHIHRKIRVHHHDPQRQWGVHPVSPVSPVWRLQLAHQGIHPVDRNPAVQQCLNSAGDHVRVGRRQSWRFSSLWPLNEGSKKISFNAWHFCLWTCICFTN